MTWIMLFIAGIFEVTWAIGLKYSESFTRLVPSIITLVAMALSIFFLSKSLKELPIGTAYAVWTGIGAAGTAIMGMILFQESREVIRILCISLIIVSTIGLKLSSR